GGPGIRARGAAGGGRASDRRAPGDRAAAEGRGRRGLVAPARLLDLAAGPALHPRHATRAQPRAGPQPGAGRLRTAGVRAARREAGKRKIWASPRRASSVTLRADLPIGSSEPSVKTEKGPRMAGAVLFVGSGSEALVEAQAPGRPISPAGHGVLNQSARMPCRYGGTPTAGRRTASSGGIS